MTIGLTAAYADFLAGIRWDAFLTLTFDRKRACSFRSLFSERADKGFRQLIQFVNERIYGKRWLRTTQHKGVIWARVDEAHQDGALHFHAVISCPSAMIAESLLRAIKDWWVRRFGIARVEVPLSCGDVLRYLTKHLAFPDRAELQISNNFQHPR